MSLEKNGQLFFWRYAKPITNEEETDLIFWAEAYSLNKEHVVYARKNQIAFFDLRGPFSKKLWSTPNYRKHF